jgi:CRISPR-associated protein Cmr1
MALEIEARYRVVTPLFCGGANPVSSSELRLPSLKGVLRFWWRALAWSRFAGDLDEIKRHEDRLFGSTSTGQAQVLMRLGGSPECAVLERGEVLTTLDDSPVGDGARYLGYGVMEAFDSHKKGTRKGQLIRACIPGPLSFPVHLRCRDLDAEDAVQLSDALRAVGLLGGLGAKSRKGYGSLVLERLTEDGVECWTPPSDVDDLKRAIRGLHGTRVSDGLPEFTAISAGSRHILLSGGKAEPLELLDLVGREMVRYRSWGHDGKILGSVDSERNFKDDHDLMDSGQRKGHPRRIAFGLPHNYGPGKGKEVGPKDSGLDRRASPLFIHIHECGGEPVAVLSFLPARFLPEKRSDISVGGTRVPLADGGSLYEPIHGFLNRLLDSTKRKEPFTDAVEVGP